jgi:hypothetical protein
MSLNLKSSYHDLEQSKLIFNKEINKWYIKNRRKLLGDLIKKTQISHIEY